MRQVTSATSRQHSTVLLELNDICVGEMVALAGLRGTGQEEMVAYFFPVVQRTVVKLKP